MHHAFPEEAIQTQCLKIVHDVLGNAYVSVFIKNFRLVENDEDKTSHVKCTISFSNDWKDIFIKGVGYGMVDALFNSMMKKFTKDFSSLSQIEFDDFAMYIKFKNLLATRTDAPVEIKRRPKDLFFFWS